MAALALAVLGGGCVQVLGTFDYKGAGGSTASSSSSGGSSSSGTSTASTSTSTSSPPRDINGTQTITYVANGSMMATKPDLTGATITVLAGPKFETFVGTGAPNGTFKVSGVPAGEYYLSFLEPGATPGAPVYYVTSSDAPDMSHAVTGRSDAAPITKATTVNLTASGLNTWANGDFLLLASPGVGVGPLGLGIATGTPPSTGATSFMGSFDAHSWFSPASLIDSSKGDHAFVYQTGPVTQGGFATSVITKSANIGNLTMTDGQVANINAALTALPQTDSVTVNWATTQFEALKSAVGPGASVASHTFAVSARVGVPTDGPSGFGVPLLSFNPPAGSDVSNVTLNFGDPLTNALVVEEVVTTFSVPVSAPGATPLSFQPNVSYAANRTTFSALPQVVPVASPVTSVMVDGTSGVAGGALASTTPTVGFGAPATGTPSRYKVAVWHLSKAGGGGTVATLVAQIYSRKTSIQVPPGLISSGLSYVFLVQADVYPGSTFDVEAAPLSNPWPMGFAQTVTAPFTAP